MNFTHRLHKDHLYPYPDNIMTFADNHDTERFATSVSSKDVELYKSAMGFLLTTRGIPQLYYGTELMMNGDVEGIYTSNTNRIQKKYPDLPMMLCSGGGGRTDYEALKYFTEFWPSDNTDAVERIFIQWGYSYLFPSKAMAAHVTSWGKQPLKFRVDVASMGKLGFDIRTHEMNENEIRFCQEAVKNFKRLSHVIGNGDMYRIVSPYEKDHAVVLYTDQAKDKAVVYAFDMHPRYAEILQPVRLQGLDANKRYKVEEINLMPGNHSALECHGKTYSGDYLMKVGIPLLSSSHLQSHVVELTAE